jgi:hypothetical protein
MPNGRQPISFRQLCLVAKELLEANRSWLTDSQIEWKEATKDRVHALGFLTPLNEEVYRALDATERAYLKRHPPKRKPPTRKPYDPTPDYITRTSPSPPNEDDSPTLEHPLRLDRMVPLASAMTPWLTLFKKPSHESGS